MSIDSEVPSLARNALVRWHRVPGIAPAATMGWKEKSYLSSLRSATSRACRNDSFAACRCSGCGVWVSAVLCLTLC